MNTHKAIIYDSECPLCAAYTKAFVKLKLLRPAERIAFSELGDQEFIPRMDRSRQGNEIPLVDLDGGKTLYGLDALVFLLSRRWKWIGTAMRFRPLSLFFRQLYAMISYNRRVILAKKFKTIACSCAPDYHVGYRLLFIVFAALISVLITWSFGVSLAQAAGYAGNFAGLKMLAACGTGWMLSILTAILFMKSDRLEYAGHLAVLQLTGVFVLVPATIAAPHLGNAGLYVCLGSALASSLLMLRGHARRISIMNRSQAWTLLWFVYLQLTAAGLAFYFMNDINFRP